MFGKVMAVLLSTIALVPAAQAQDGEAQDGRNVGMSRRGEMREIQQRRAEARGDATPQYQRQERREAPEQNQRPAEPQRAEQMPRFQRQPEQPRAAPQAPQAPQTPQAQFQQRAGRGYGDGARGNMFFDRAQRQQAEQQAQAARQRDHGQDRSWDRGNTQGDWRGNGVDRPAPNVVDQRRPDFNRNVGDQRRWDGGSRRDNDDRRFGDNRGLGAPATNWHGRADWNRGWRSDNRFDWNRYRTTNRNLFRLPRYYAPSNWNYGYRRFSIGVTLSSLLWEQDYWIDDPSYYRLPPAYGPYRWVRYYNDALLVDIRSGYVVDTVYDIFW